MRIEKVLNNNVVVVIDNDHKEKIVMGRGIAFKKKVGEEFDEGKIDKVFTLSNTEVVNKFQELIVDIPMEHLELAEEIISYARLKQGKQLNEMVYISVVDHIYTAIQRFLEGVTIKNVLLWDIKRFYPDEFAIGLEALHMIEKRFNVKLPEDEAGFIALHLVHAGMNEEDIQDVVEITKCMQEIINIVKYKFNVTFDEEGVYYYRFITHLKFFAQRLISKKTYEEDSDDELYEVIKNKYKNAFECVESIAAFILKKYHYTLSHEEMLYLTIHIERVIYKAVK